LLDPFEPVPAVLPVEAVLPVPAVLPVEAVLPVAALEPVEPVGCALTANTAKATERVKKILFMVFF
jgi:hypothetical protein